MREHAGLFGAPISTSVPAPMEMWGVSLLKFPAQIRWLMRAMVVLLAGVVSMVVVVVFHFYYHSL